jgi:hypothetical protein
VPALPCASGGASGGGRVVVAEVFSAVVAGSSVCMWVVRGSSLYRLRFFAVVRVGLGWMGVWVWWSSMIAVWNVRAAVRSV